jgi:glycosyltransferase involved in cell wall biosynthesis
MKVLLVSQYFWPENFRVNDIALGLKERGHEVIVFTGKPNYPAGKFFKGYGFFKPSKENWKGITIHRSLLIPRMSGSGSWLAINYFSFLVAGSLKALFLNIKPDKILVYQLSPVTMAIPAIVFKWKTKASLFLYIQDLWPQSIVAASGIKSKWMVKVLEQLTQWIYRQSDILLIQSKAFRNYLEINGVLSSKIIYLPNSTDLFYKPVEKKKELEKYFPGKFNIVFAGNIGEAQSFNTLISAAALVKKSNPCITWVIIGQGRKKAELEQRVFSEGLSDIFTFIGAFEPMMMPAFFTYADALILSLKKDFIFTLTIPNKLQSYMACAKPVMGSLDGEGSNIIQEAACGFTSPAEDAVSLAANLLHLVQLSDEDRKRLGQNAYHYFHNNFDRDLLMDKLSQILQSAPSINL